MSTAPTIPQMLFGLYGYLIPLLLYVMWSTLALDDLGRRADLKAGRVWGWTSAIYLVPFVGPLLYLSVGGSRIARSARMIAVLGGIGLYAVVLVIATVLSST